jgi:hypothetical protein
MLNVVYGELDSHLILSSDPQLRSLGMDSAEWALKCQHVQIIRGKCIHPSLCHSLYQSLKAEVETVSETHVLLCIDVDKSTAKLYNFIRF